MTTPPRYTRALAMHVRLSKGGYLVSYEILDGEKSVGSITVSRPTRTTDEKVTYHLGEQEFGTAAEWKAAYEATL